MTASQEVGGAAFGKPPPPRRADQRQRLRVVCREHDLGDCAVSAASCASSIARPRIRATGCGAARVAASPRMCEISRFCRPRSARGASAASSRCASMPKELLPPASFSSPLGASTPATRRSEPDGRASAAGRSVSPRDRRPADSPNITVRRCNALSSSALLPLRAQLRRAAPRLSASSSRLSFGFLALRVGFPLAPATRRERADAP